MAAPVGASSAGFTPPTSADAAPQAASAAATPGFIARFGVASFANWLALLTPVVVTLALRVQAVDPAHKERSLGLVLGVGAFLATVANPLVGRLSDRTMSRYGRRRPWLVVGALGGVVGLGIIAVVPSVPAILIGWSICQLAFNAVLAALTAVIPDQVPVASRGRVSGIFGLSQNAAVMAGAFVAQAFAGHSVPQFLVPAVIAVLAIGVLVFGLPDRRLSRRPQPFSVREFIGSFWVNPVRHPNFAWAWFTRFLAMFGTAIPQAYLVYFLPTRLGTSTGQVAGQAAELITIASVCTLAMAGIGGWVSDRTGRRKAFVIGAAVLISAGLFLLAIAPTFAAIAVAEVVFGLGNGMFLAVDLALVTQVLPSAETVGKDLGVINIANALPQSLAPAVAPAVLLAGGYSLLFAVAAVSLVLAAVLVTRIKGVR
ncbi:MFS transporter [Planosporangium thailandense]|uniref:MFS transporter n=1 Tax=Planosporangium thailandense TaxID=765197 RepID=A0ABX0Y574_9ACTN|nr:MFS transporter [Planosporangium thailandense]NJC73188.1 MFS transporter [Planosporangium thailandense]